MRTLLLITLSFFASDSKCDLLRDSVHVTSAAARPNNELWCFRCLAEVAGDDCANLQRNNTAFVHKCHNDKRVCMVKRFSFTTSTENSTTALKMWALERNCTKHCEPGCIVIGERTKLYAYSKCDLLRDSVHVTSAAARPNNELWCFRCLAEVAGDDCANLQRNNTAFVHKCHNDKRVCMVKRFSFTTSTENSTTALKMWALERNCTKHCEPGCIVIGERTKLYACTSCCTEQLCNVGSDGVRVHVSSSLMTVLALFLLVNFVMEKA